VFNALVNAFSDGEQYNQSQAALILQNSRLLTADDAAADTFFAQFNFTRLPAVAATGLVTFSRFVAASAALILPGVQLKTTDGSLSFTVTTDLSNPLWNIGIGGYLIPINTLSATVPIVASTLGSASNVQSGTISLIASSISGVDTVTNGSAFSNGVDAESTPAAIIRFWKFLNTRSLATAAAVEYAISTVQQGLSYSIVENPSERDGAFLVYVDDGSGAPSATLMQAISTAIDPVRPISITYILRPANVVYADISLTIYAISGYNIDALRGLVSQAIEAKVNTLGVSETLAYYDIAAIAKNIEGVAKIESLLLNGDFQDIGGNIADSVHTRTVVVAG